MAVAFSTVASYPHDKNHSHFSAAIANLVAAASATDVFCLQGSATRRVTVRGLSVSGTAQTTTDSDFFLIKRSTPNTGGTPLIITPVSHGPGTATAVATAYTANPTLGVGVGTFLTWHVPFLGGNTVILPFVYLLNPGIVLNGVNEWLCMNLNGQTINNSQIHMNWEWDEDAV